MKTSTISLKKHQQYGAKLKVMREDILFKCEHIDLLNKLSNRNSPARKTLKLIDALRNNLDDIACQDLGKNFSTSLYYGGESV